MGKIKETRELYKEVINEVSQSAEHWRDFLDSSSWNFKYNFDDQILIYAQKSDARACATMNEWNKKLKRWIKKGSKPIYVFDKNPYSEYPFKLIFDISDTYNYNNTEYKLWSIKEEYEKNVIEDLEANFGIEDENLSLETAINYASYNMVEDNIEDYLEKVINSKSNSALNDMTDDEIKSIMTSTIWASVAYMVMTRCGIEAKKEIDLQEFSYINYFDTPELITTIGACVSDIAEMGLREIARTITSLQKQEKLKNRTIAQIDKEIYAKTKENLEGGIEDGENRIHETGGLLSTKSSNGERESSSREIRVDEIQLPKESQELRVNDVDNGKEIDGTSSSNSNTSTRESEFVSRADGEERGNNRGIESSRSNEMGTTDEQLENDSRGNGNERTNLRLNENNLKRKPLSKQEMNSEIDYLRDKYVSDILSNVHNLKVTRKEIKDFYETHLDKTERTEYIKGIFSDSYTEIVVDDVRLGYKTYENVLHLWKDDYSNRTAEVYYKWELIAEYIEGLILVNEFNDIHKPIQNEIDQMQILQVGVNEASAFSFTQEIIDYALQGGSNIQESKMRIYRQFEHSLSSADNIKFLKNEYGWGGSSSIHIGTGIGIDYNGKGITLYRGYEDNAPTILLNWNKVEKRIRELIKDDRYLNPKEKEEYSNWLKEKGIEETSQENNINIPIMQVEQETEKNYEYHLGDTIYFGADEYEIASIAEDTITLFDTKFPLFTKQVSLEEFDRKLRENPSNNHLIVKEQEITTIEVDVDKEYEKELQSREVVKNNIEKFLQNMFVKYATCDYKITTDENNDLEIRVRGENDSEYKDISVVTALKYLLNITEEYDKNYVGEDEINLSNELEKAREKQRQNIIDKEIISHDGNIYKVIGVDEETETEDLAVIQNNETKETTIEPISYIEYLIVEGKKQEKQVINSNTLSNHAIEKDIKPKFVKTSNKIQDFVLHPEVPLKDRNDYKITNDNLGIGTPREKFVRNIEAIKTLKKCETEGRYATSEEQEILAQYVGWGGLDKVFDEKDSSWSNENKILKELLNDEEYRNARASSLTAFYTPPVVIESMYKILKNMGLKEANILEPSCGVGNFFGMLPEELSNCKMYGVELDNISGRIAQQLYQKSTIAVEGYEKVSMPDNFFDIAIRKYTFWKF